jgi:hypothetical protein
MSTAALRNNLLTLEKLTPGFSAPKQHFFAVVFFSLND